MRCDEFRDRWQAALRTARLLSHNDRPEDVIDLTRMERRWRVRLMPRSAEPLNLGATISFRWDPFDSARSYTCEEDLLTELFGRSRARRSTQRRLLRERRLRSLVRPAQPWRGGPRDRGLHLSRRRRLHPHGLDRGPGRPLKISWNFPTTAGH